MDHKVDEGLSVVRSSGTLRLSLVALRMRLRDYLEDFERAVIPIFKKDCDSIP